MALGFFAFTSIHFQKQKVNVKDFALISEWILYLKKKRLFFSPKR